MDYQLNNSKLQLILLLLLPQLILTFGAIETKAQNPGQNNNNIICTPYEWSTNTIECNRRLTASLPNPNYNFQRSGSVDTSGGTPYWEFPSIPPFDNNNYFTNWRAGLNNWQANFQNQLQQNLAKMQQRFAELEKQLKAQAELNRQNPNSYHQSFQSSSFSDSSGTSESVLSSSNNDGSWTIRSNGLGISSSSQGHVISINAHIGNAENYETKIINDKELLVEVKYPNDTIKRWMSIKITAGNLNVNDFIISRPQSDTILIQSPPPPPPPASASG